MCPTPLSQPVKYNASYENHKNLMQQYGIYCNKALHQGRGEGQRNLDDKGVLLTDIQRMCHYLASDQFKSYMLNAPVRGVAAAAGYDKDDLRGVFAPHLSIIAAELVAHLFPALVNEEQKVEARLKELQKEGGSAKRRRRATTTMGMEPTRRRTVTWGRAHAAGGGG